MTQNISAYTLVDITETQVKRIRESNTQEYHQQQNYNVLLQTCGLRTQIFDPQVTIHTDARLPEEFADAYCNVNHTYWQLSFQIETDMVWSDGENELALLEQDVHGIAITSDLDNTAEFPVNMFDTRDMVNTFFVTH